MKIKTEYKVGFVGIVTILVLYFGIMFLKGKDIFNVETNYYAVFDNVSGLYKSNYIYLNGMKVGYIKNITMIDHSARKFLIQIAITSDIQIPNDSKIMIFSADMLGSKALKIDMGISKTLFQKRDTIESGVENGIIDQLSNNITPVVVKLNNVMSHFDTLLVNVNNVLDEKTQNDIKSSMENINIATKNLKTLSINMDNLIAEEKIKLKEIISNVNHLTNTLNNNSNALTNAINNFSNISDTVAKANLGNTIRQTNLSINSLSQILQSINRGEGSVGLLIKDDKLYKNLETSTKKLDALIEDIKQNPKKYINLSIF
ncbi:MAG: MlaD family protein [Bacteroidales bacterium]|jgi:phospholipid/cholesterol/gamma-HCH transport system substrate-binding protein|nr:MlaD family protein [Bacteroidales bacterium]